MPYKDKTKSLEAVKRHYAKHSDEMLKQRVIDRILEGKRPQTTTLAKFEITETMVNEMRAEAGLEPIKIKPTRKKKEKKDVPVRTITMETIHDHYNKLAEDNKIAGRTGETHYSNLKRMFPADTDVGAALKDPTMVIKMISVFISAY